MKVGISMIYKRVDASTPNPGAFALECEQLGLESVWVGDHMLFHAEPRTPFPAGGAGWLREAAVPLGSDFDHRWTQAAEYIAAMRELWIKPVASFHGKYVNFDGIVCNPKPAQRPGPPVLIGSLDRNALKWVARWGDGYNPVCFDTSKAVKFMRRKLAELKDECAKVGRDAGKLDVTLMISLPGERAHTQELFGEFSAMGVNRVVEVSASEPLFVGDYHAKLERLARTAL